MKTAIAPDQFKFPGGAVPTHLVVRVASYQIGESAVAFYELQDEKGAALFSGNTSLTDEQFAAWGADDNYFVRCVADNIGVKLA